MRIATCWGRPCPVKIWDVRIHSCHLDSTFNEPQKISCREGTQKTLGHRRFPLSCGVWAPNALICCWGKATLHTPAWGANSITRSLPRWQWAYILIITFWAVNMPSDAAMLLNVSCDWKQWSDLPAMASRGSCLHKPVWPNHFLSFFNNFGRMGI